MDLALSDIIENANSTNSALVVMPAVAELAPAAIGRGGYPSLSSLILDSHLRENDGGWREWQTAPLVIPAVCGGDPSEKISR